jgi:hypothetical protein
MVAPPRRKIPALLAPRPAWVRWRSPRGDDDTITFYGRTPTLDDQGGPWRVERNGFWLPVSVTAFDFYSERPERHERVGFVSLTTRTWVIAAIAHEDREVLRAAPDGDQWWRRMSWVDEPAPGRRYIDLDMLAWRGGLP